MRITFLGTGTSQGVPMIGCHCDICSSTDKKDKRLRSSIAVETKGKRLIIDTGPDFRYQMLREGYDSIDGVLFTHSHKDHTAGLDDVRAYNYVLQRDMDIYAEERCMEVIRKDFDYAFSEYKYPGVPEINAHTITSAPFMIGDIEIIPIRALHHKLEVLGYRIGRMAYLTDMNYIAPSEIEKMKGIEVLIITALRHDKHISHFSLREAIAVSEQIGCPHTYFTHISHQLGRYKELNPILPIGMELAYDRLTIEISD